MSLRIPTKTLLSALGIDATPDRVDAGRHRLDIERVAYTVMHSTESLQPLLWPQQSLLSDSHFGCLTFSHVRRRPIYRYCELCLRSDSIPYIRQLWRLACAYVCPKHLTVLRELCPNCQKAFRMPEYNRWKKERPLQQCHACGFDLRAAPPAFLPEELGYFVLSRQAELLNLVSAESRLPETWNELKTSSDYEFDTDASGRIDLESEQNVRMLFTRVLTSHLARQELPIEHSRHLLDSYLLKIPLPVSEDEITYLPVAFDGRKIFGARAAEVFMNLLERHDPWGATHWGSEELVYELLGTSIFNFKEFSLELQRGWPPEWAHKKRRRGQRKYL